MHQPIKQIIFFWLLVCGLLLFEASAKCSITFCKISQHNWFSSFDRLFLMPWLGAIVFLIPFMLLILTISDLKFLHILSALILVSSIHLGFFSARLWIDITQYGFVTIFIQGFLLWLMIYVAILLVPVGAATAIIQIYKQLRKP